MAIEFQIKESELIKGVFIIKPNKFKDLRGEIWTAFTSKDIDKLLPSGIRFIHDKFISSKHNVLRGTHGDEKTYKLATCLSGEVQQVVVDCRKQSPSYLKWQSFIINADNQLLILVPAGCGNAHLVRSKQAIYYYKCAYEGAYNDADEQFTLAYDDKRVGVKWEFEGELVLSSRDLEVRS